MKPIKMSIIFFLLIITIKSFAQINTDITNKSLAKDKTETTQEQKTKKQRKAKSLHLMGLGFGPTFLTNFTIKELGYHINLVHVFDVSPNFSINGSGNVLFDEKVNFLIDANIGLRGFFNTKYISPFIGANLGLGVAYANTKTIKSVFGFTLTGIAGLQFFHETDTHLDLLASYKTLLRDNKKGYPQALSFMLNVSFPV